MILAVSALIDRLFFGEWVFTPLNFLRFNLVNNISLFYGSHPWHWYLSQGIPVVFLTFTPLVVLGIARSKRFDLAVLMGWTVLVYSCLGHKEFRFLLPLLPLGLSYVGFYLFSLVKIIPFKSLKLFGTHGPQNRTRLSPGSQGKEAPESNIQTRT